METPSTITSRILPILLAPLKLLKRERIYWCWLVTLIISYLGILVNVLNANYEACFSYGAFYSTGITIITPFCLELLIQSVVRKKNGEDSKFQSYQAGILSVCILYIVIAGVSISIERMNGRIYQLICLVITVIFSFYVYLVSKMEDHSKALEKFTDKSYAEMEKESIERMNEAAKEIEGIVLEDGGSIKL